MTRTQSSPEVLEERVTRCLETVVILAIPLLLSGMVGILLMSEGEETRAANSVGPVWGSWMTTSLLCAGGSASAVSCDQIGCAIPARISRAEKE